MEDFREYKDILIAGLKVHCKNCRSTKFKVGEAQLNTRGLTLLNLDWLNESSTILICKRCGCINWFLKSKYDIKIVEDIKFEKEEFCTDIKESIECLNCGKIIYESENKCSNCGWTYK